MSFLSVATTKPVVLMALKISLIVGTLLVFINQYSVILSGHFTPESILQIILTYMVPYCVSTYSSVAAIRAQGHRPR